MTNTPRVSVVITAFNRAGTIARAIDSVMAQTVDDFEIIVVDDASTDETAMVVEGLRNPKVRLIRNAVNKGIGGAKNVGVGAARGEYIAFLDSDDEWLPNKLQRQLAEFAADPAGPPLSFHAFWVHRMDTGKVVLRRPRKYGTWLRSILLGETFSLGSTLLARRELFDDVGLFDEGLARLQDRDWTIRYLDRYEEFRYLPEPLARIYNSGWPAAALVTKSVNALYRVNEARLVRRDPRNARLFRSSLDFEIAVAIYRNGRLMTALARLFLLILRNPGFFGYLAGRVWRKLRQRDFG